MFITLVWNEQQSFYLDHFHIIILPILFLCQISASFIELHTQKKEQEGQLYKNGAGKKIVGHSKLTFF